MSSKIVATDVKPGEDTVPREIGPPEHPEV
jgi:hypothetical protein